MKAGRSPKVSTKDQHLAPLIGSQYTASTTSVTANMGQVRYGEHAVKFLITLRLPQSLMGECFVCMED